MYLPERAGTRFSTRLVSYLPTGELVCDVFSRVAVRLGRLNPVVRRTGASLHWGIDDPRELERRIPALGNLGRLPRYRF
jgi:O-methyltransferase involved in polyketide biosynthesis